MKKETIELLRKDLISNLNKNKRFEKNKERYGYTYELEYIPVLVERTKEGKCGEITFPQNGLIYESENK